jgi:glucokinase
MNYYLGFDIGGTSCGVVLANEQGSIRAQQTILTDHQAGPYETIRQLCATAGAFARDLKHELGREPCALGISCGGPLDSQAGVVHSPPNLPGWDAVPIVQIVQTTLGIPAALQNDANACALAEWRYGAGQGTENMLFLTFGTGMGAGMILNGRIYTGTNDMAGEIGHVRMEPDGPLGYGKTGSFEGFCSGAGIARLARSCIRAEWKAGREVSFCSTEQQLDQLSARDLGKAAYGGDLLAREILEVSAEYLGRGLAILIDLLNPQCIVIGSIFVRLEQFLRPRMEQVIQRECLSRAAQVCRVVPAALGEEVGFMAALSVAQQIGPKGETQ